MENKHIKISLILATVDRIKEVETFLESLSKQTYKNFEVIVADQNKDNRLIPLIERYQEEMTIIHLKNLKRGLSRARNVAIKHISGNIVGFPDDDCFYPPNMLEKLVEAFQLHPDIDVIVPDGEKTSSVIGKFMNFLYRGKPKRVSYLSLPKSIDLFIRSQVVQSIGLFDETLGLGSGTPWIACEEMDYEIRILKAGFNMYRINLPKAIDYSELKNQETQKPYLYGLSAGYVWRKHNLPLWLGSVRIGAAIFSMLEMLVSGNVQKAYHQLYWIRGFMKGLLEKW